MYWFAKFWRENLSFTNGAGFRLWVLEFKHRNLDLLIRYCLSLSFWERWTYLLMYWLASYQHILIPFWQKKKLQNTAKLEVSSTNMWRSHKHNASGNRIPLQRWRRGITQIPHPCAIANLSSLLVYTLTRTKNVQCHTVTTISLTIKDRSPMPISLLFMYFQKGNCTHYNLRDERWGEEKWECHNTIGGTNNQITLLQNNIYWNQQEVG